MKPIFGYYGGKQRMAHNIIPHIPRHTVYVEPFAGSAAIFWMRQIPNIANRDNYCEVLNDKDEEIINFYRVLQNQQSFDALQHRLDFTPYSRLEHKKAKERTGTTPEERAWDFLVNVLMGFGGQLDTGYGYALKSRNLATYFLKQKNLRKYAERLLYCNIECLDALEIIRRYDSPQTFFYCDPPYPGSVQGHYGGYSIEDYQNLIEVLKTIKGSFILSNYRQGIEPEEWHSYDFDAQMSILNGKDRIDVNTKRTETIWVVDNGGGIEDPHFRKIYETAAFREVWPMPELGLFG